MQMEPLQNVVEVKNRRVWRDLAKILSTVLNPFVTALALFIILAHASARSTGDFYRLLFFSTFFTSLGPMLYVFWLYSRDRISDLDMSIRAEREAVFGVFVVFYLLGTVTLWFAHAPRLIIAAMAAYTLSTLVVQYITRYWKISTHAIGITAPFVALVMLYGLQPLPFVVLIPMVGWARVYLKAHTLMQVLAGMGLATFSTVLFFWVLHIRMATF